MTAPGPRSRAASISYWSLVVASVALMAFGLLMVFPAASGPAFFRGAGVLFAVAGMGLAFLSGRARGGDVRFRNATVALALALVILLAVFSLISHGLVWLLIMIVLLVGAILMVRSADASSGTDGSDD